MAYAMGYGFGVDNDLVYDFLLGVGDAINATGLEVIKKKVKFKIKHNKFLSIKIKVKFEDGTKMKFQHKEPIKCKGKLVQVDPKDLEGGGQGDATDEVLKQLEEAFGVKGKKEEDKAQKQIGFKLD